MELSNLLLEDEQVLWKHSNEINLYKKFKINIILGILGFIVMAIVLLFIGIFINQLQVYPFGMFWIVLIFGGFILFQYHEYALLKKRLTLTNDDLKAYPESFYFTNRRCILKSYKIFKIDLKKFSNYEIHQDYFILKHIDITQIIVSLYKNKYIIWISEKPFKKSIDWPSFIKFEIPNDKFNKFFEIMKDFLLLQVVDNSIENITRYKILIDDK